MKIYKSPLICQGKGEWNLVEGGGNLVIGEGNLAKGRKLMRRWRRMSVDVKAQRGFAHFVPIVMNIWVSTLMLLYFL